MSDYLKPKAAAGNLGKRHMQNGMFRNPPTYSQLGGFTSERKLTDPAGKRDSISGMSLERGGPTAQKGKPI
jgi:hypothetical protein